VEEEGPALRVLQARAALFPHRFEDRPALWALATLAIHITQLRWLDLVAAFRTESEECAADLLRAEFGAPAHAPIVCCCDQKMWYEPQPDDVTAVSFAVTTAQAGHFCVRDVAAAESSSG
jgi:hypothetical protein